MTNRHGYELEHRVRLSEGVELCRFQGVPAEQVSIVGSISDEVDSLISALRSWAEDPEGFWTPDVEKR